ncbi:hypothetical protein DIP76_05315 [Neisseria gonorrhoeae]
MPPVTPARRGKSRQISRRRTRQTHKNAQQARCYVLKHRPEPDIIRPSTSVKIFFLTGQTDIGSRK